MSKPRLAVTMGDPAGIGAEIVVKTFADSSIFDRARPFVIGSVACLELALEQTGIQMPVKRIRSVDDQINSASRSWSRLILIYLSFTSEECPQPAATRR